nr:hypothetical protein [Tanacetum cinerariifolium]
GQHVGGVGQLLFPVGQLGFHVFLAGLVYLVDQHVNGRVLGFAQALDHGLFVVLFVDVGDEQYYIGIFQGRVHEGHHGVVQLVFGLDDAGRIGINQLEISAVEDAQDAVARGLGFARDDAQALAY